MDSKQLYIKNKSIVYNFMFNKWEVIMSRNNDEFIPVKTILINNSHCVIIPDELVFVFDYMPIVHSSLINSPTTPSTIHPTNPSFVNSTDSSTKPSTESSSEPSTEHPTNSPTEPSTEHPTNSPTEPSTEQTPQNIYDIIGDEF